MGRRFSTTLQRYFLQPKSCLHRFSTAFLLLISLFFCIIRFCGLEYSPPGFYADESAAATHLLCLLERGHDANGNTLPSYSLGLTGIYGPVFLYVSALWASIFGSSIGSLRASSAFFTTLTIAGIVAIAYRELGPRAALATLLAASLSPWGFQFSRIFWDPPVMPCLLVWGVYFLLAGKTYKALTASGICLSLAMLTYPPARAQVPLLIPALLVFKFRKGLVRKELAVWFLALVLSSTPLIYGTFFGPLFDRYQGVGLFGSYYLSNHTYWEALKTLVTNVLAHFSVNYLFSAGDGNLRHSTGQMGVLGWIDIFSLAFSVGLMAIGIYRKSVFTTYGMGRRETGKRALFLVLMSLWAVLCGVLPAALTHEGVPHALRSIGCWPFVALITGCGIAAMMRRRVRYLVPIVLLVGLTQSVYFSNAYFIEYPKRSADWYDSWVKDRATEGRKTGDWRPLLAAKENHPALSLRYYLMEYRRMRCSDSAAELR